MPSLRRSSTSSSVRSSPYPSTVPGGTRGRARGPERRRPSGSETSVRRVLADIEWWRVVDGQRDPEHESNDSENEENQRDGYPVRPQVQPSDHLLSGADAGVERPSTPPLSWVSLIPESPESRSVPITQFSALSITPDSPTRGRHVRSASASSVESSPGGFNTSFDLADLDLAFEDNGSPLLFPPQFRNRVEPPPFILSALRGRFPLELTRPSIPEGISHHFFD